MRYASLPHAKKPGGRSAAFLVHRPPSLSIASLTEVQNRKGTEKANIHSAAPEVELSTMMSASSDFSPLFDNSWLVGPVCRELMRKVRAHSFPHIRDLMWQKWISCDGLHQSKLSVWLLAELHRASSHSKRKVKVGWWISNSVAALTPSPLYNFEINWIRNFYRTWVRSFCTHVTNWLIDSVLFTRLDWYSGCWKC